MTAKLVSGILAASAVKTSSGALPAQAINADLWRRDPVLYWRHAAKPKAGADVHVLAGEEPLLVSWKAGKGGRSCSRA